MTDTVTFLGSPEMVEIQPRQVENEHRYIYSAQIDGVTRRFALESIKKGSVPIAAVTDALRRAAINKTQQAAVASTNGRINVYLYSGDTTSGPACITEGVRLANGSIIGWSTLHDVFNVMSTDADKVPLAKNESRDVVISMPIATIQYMIRRYIAYFNMR